MTANDLIAGAMRLIGVIATGETVSPDDAAVGLEALQEMIDGWNADGLAIYTTGSNDFALTAGKQVYTLGPSGDFNMTRPAFIVSMSALLLDNPSNPVEIPLEEYTVDDWEMKIPVKNVSASFPQVWYDTGDYPVRSINLWPYPNTSQNKLRIYSWQPLTSPASFVTVMAFPPGYAEAFKYNLAARLSGEFGTQLPPQVQLGAVESMARIKRINSVPRTLQSDLSATSGYNWSADIFGNPYQ